MGVSRRALIGLLITAGLLLAGAGTSAAWNTPDTAGPTDSTISADGATAQADPLTGQGVERGGNPFNVRGTAAAVATQLAGGPLVFNGSGYITCLDIRGNTAGTTVRITRSPNPALIGRDAYGTFIDGGPGGVDYANLVPGVGPTVGCAPQPQLAVFPFTRGSLVIKDGQHPGKK